MTLQVATAPINGLRDQNWVLNPVTGLYEPSVLMEGSRTNSALWSRDLTNAVWVRTGSGTATLDSVGIDGTGASATTLTDSDAALLTEYKQITTVPVDSNTHVISFWVRKDTDQTRFPMCYANISGGTVVSRGVGINTQTGASTSRFIAGTTSFRVVDGGPAWWIVEITLTNNSTAGNTALAYQINPARESVLGGGDNVSATGSCGVGQVQVELNSSFYSSPIFTTTAPVNRGADSYSVPFTTPPQAMTLYSKFKETGTTQLTGFQRIVQIGGAGGSVSDRVLNIRVAANKYQLSHENGDGTGGVFSSAAAAPAIGDTVEVRAVLNADGSVQLGQTINGAAEVVASASGSKALAATWFGNTLLLAPSSFAAFLVPYKVALGVKSLTEMRNLRA